jgi:phosphoribosylanthranilate isomerase
MIKVKVCGMRDKMNILRMTETQPDYMGFIFYPQSARYIGTDRSVINQVTAGIKRVGVFVNEDPQKIVKTADVCQLDLIQLHGNESVQTCREIKSAGFQVIKSFALDEKFDFSVLIPYLAVCDYFLFDRKSELYGGTGQKFNWDLISGYPYQTPFFLSGGISLSDASRINDIKHRALHAVDINSRFETEPGLKDVEKVKEFIDEIRLRNEKKLK